MQNKTTFLRPGKLPATMAGAHRLPNLTLVSGNVFFTFSFMLLLLLSMSLSAQNPCRQSEVMQAYYLQHPDGKIRASQLELFTKQFIENKKTARFGQGQEYTIPVVFHVFGTDFISGPVTTQTIINALKQVNDDFHGTNDDFNSIDPLFNGIKESMNIWFKLAQRDPRGNPTTGINFYPVERGFGNGGGYDNKIRQYAWDNKRYCNVYIMLDLYDDGDYFNSGVAWYPDQYMTDNNLSRIVYNGRYLFGNTNKEFSSTLSHEFGHWLNLIHTFEGGCAFPNDRVDDTPPESSSTGECRGTLNCFRNPVNGENYMGYTGASKQCYKMFTRGQVARMEAGVQSSPRFPLWQRANLISTGLINGGGDNLAPTAPAGLTASNTTATATRLSWSASTDNVGVTGYDIIRGSTVIGNTTTTSFNVTGLTPATTYSFTVKAKDAAGNISPASNVVIITTNTSNGYCTVTNNTSGQYLTRVIFGNINNASGFATQGYADYTAQFATAARGSTVSLSLTLQSWWAGTRAPAWIDWNRDGDFTDAGEQVLNASGTAVGDYTTPVTIPATALTGTTRMRIRAEYGEGAIQPCGNGWHSEVEDYSVNVTASAPGLGANDPVKSLTPAITTASPIPFDDRINITYVAAESGNVVVRLFDQKGNMVKQMAVRVNKGSNLLQLNDLSGLISGFYVLDIAGGRKHVRLKVIK